MRPPGHELSEKIRYNSMLYLSSYDVLQHLINFRHLMRKHSVYFDDTALLKYGFENLKILTIAQDKILALKVITPK